MSHRGKIGFLEAFTIGVGGMIGGGIFAVLGLSISVSRYASPVAFAIAGLVALLTGYSYAKLSVRYPSRGGTIEFIVRAYGSGVLSGGLNLLLFTSYTIMIALYAFAFGHYAAAGLGLGSPWPSALSVAVILAFTAVNALGAVVSGRVEDVLVMVKLGILALVGGIGLFLVNFSRLSPSNWPPAVSVIAGGMLIFLAYEGFELISNAAMDVYDHRIIPKALLASILTTIAVYIVIAVVSVGVLPLQEVIRAKDYALAIVAEPVLGRAGFFLIVLGAVLSTASAINATLYGTAGITYLIAKIGHLPKELGRHIWRGATEGLIAVSAISIAFALKAPLETISFAGSAGFLTIFTAVNLAALRLRREAKVNAALALLASALSSVALAILIYNQLRTSLAPVEVFLLVLALSFIAEVLVRGLTGRRIHEYVDELLKVREELVREWEAWVPRFVRELSSVLGRAEFYLIGSVAREERERSHDIDILVVVERKLGLREGREAVSRALRRAGLSDRHPVHVHFATKEEAEEYLKRSKKYRRLQGQDRS
jgi:amino acid transporter